MGSGMRLTGYAFADFVDPAEAADAAAHAHGDATTVLTCESSNNLRKGVAAAAAAAVADGGSSGAPPPAQLTAGSVPRPRHPSFNHTYPPAHPRPTHDGVPHRGGGDLTLAPLVRMFPRGACPDHASSEPFPHGGQGRGHHEPWEWIAPMPPLPMQVCW